MAKSIVKNGSAKSIKAPKMAKPMAMPKNSPKLPKSPGPKNMVAGGTAKPWPMPKEMMATVKKGKKK